MVFLKREYSPIEEIDLERKESEKRLEKNISTLIDCHGIAYFADKWKEERAVVRVVGGKPESPEMFDCLYKVVSLEGKKYWEFMGADRV